MIEHEIEVFRAGTPAARGITADQLAEVATFDCSEKPVALCFGHPENDTPAAGGIGGFRVDGNSLFAKITSLTEKAIDGIKGGEWLDRSMAFFHPNHEANPRPGKWSPRHVGLLGGAAPGIPGMAPLKKALAFDAAGELSAEGAPADAVVYEAAPTTVHTVFSTKEPPVTDQTADTEFAARVKAADEREAAIAAREKAAAERVRNTFNASNGGAIDALVQSGKVLPTEVDGLKLAFAAFDPEAEELTFGAGDKATKASAASHLLAFLATALPKRIPLGERQSPDTQFAADAPATPQAFNVLVEARMKEKGMTFAAAAEEIEAETRG